jgi:hypothetical protein
VKLASSNAPATIDLHGQQGEGADLPALPNDVLKSMIALDDFGRFIYGSIDNTSEQTVEITRQP